MHTRKFTIIDYPNEGKYYGKYAANTPIRAASKAFSYLSRTINLKNTDDKNFIVFAIKDLENDKIYKYIGTRIELYQPKIVNVNGKNISYKYNNIITKYDNVISL